MATKWSWVNSNGSIFHGTAQSPKIEQYHVDAGSPVDYRYADYKLSETGRLFSKIPFHASSSQIQEAYAALSPEATGNTKQVSHFNRAIWNDLVDKVVELQIDYAGVARDNTFASTARYNSYPTATGNYNFLEVDRLTSPYMSDLDYFHHTILDPAAPGGTHENTGSILKAYKFNLIVNILKYFLPGTEWEWEKDGFQQIAKGVPVKAKYILQIPEVINHFIDINVGDRLVGISPQIITPFSTSTILSSPTDVVDSIPIRITDLDTTLYISVPTIIQSGSIPIVASETFLHGAELELQKPESCPIKTTIRGLLILNNYQRLKIFVNPVVPLSSEFTVADDLTVNATITKAGELVELSLSNVTGNVLFPSINILTASSVPFTTEIYTDHIAESSIDTIDSVNIPIRQYTMEHRFSAGARVTKTPSQPLSLDTHSIGSYNIDSDLELIYPVHLVSDAYIPLITNIAGTTAEIQPLASSYEIVIDTYGDFHVTSSAKLSSDFVIPENIKATLKSLSTASMSSSTSWGVSTSTTSNSREPTNLTGGIDTIIGIDSNLIAQFQKKLYSDNLYKLLTSSDFKVFVGAELYSTVEVIIEQLSILNTYISVELSAQDIILLASTANKLTTKTSADLYSTVVQIIITTSELSKYDAVDLSTALNIVCSSYSNLSTYDSRELYTEYQVIYGSKSLLYSLDRIYIHGNDTNNLISHSLLNIVVPQILTAEHTEVELTTVSEIKLDEGQYLKSNTVIELICDSGKLFATTSTVYPNAQWSVIFTPETTMEAQAQVPVNSNTVIRTDYRSQLDFATQLKSEAIMEIVSAAKLYVPSRNWLVTIPVVDNNSIITVRQVWNVTQTDNTIDIDTNE